MTLTTDDVKEIFNLLEESVFDELRLEMGELKLILRRRGASPVDLDKPSPAAPLPLPTTRPVLPADGGASVRAAHPGQDPNAPEALVEVRAPVLGTFYRAPKPGEPPFIDVGSKLQKDTSVGIIEVMKLMNTVVAGVIGAVAEICVEDGQLVEYGQVLIRVREEG
jgi:acetyl-CoA carboxylase biotin carboxyl carrier protein